MEIQIKLLNTMSTCEALSSSYLLSPQISPIMTTYASNKRYERKESIVVAMDIGKKNSRVAFTHFIPDSRPQVYMVTHWPGQGTLDDPAKIPSIVSYQNSVVKACGLEAIYDFEEHPENVAHWFKLHLHPATMLQTSDPQRFEIPPLPIGVTIERVYSDFMRYLMKNTQHFFKRTATNGEQVWARLRDTITIVLATPNNWGIREQATLRKAAIGASLVTKENARRLVHFITEAEASVHYMLANSHGEWLKRDTVFAVIDCGGFTVDTTVYRCVSLDPLDLKEACSSKSVQTGGIFVDREVEKMLRRRLSGSLYDDPEVIRGMVESFENEVKPVFDDTDEEYGFKCGYERDNEPSRGINKGKITISAKDLKDVFDVVISEIVTTCFRSLVDQKATYAILVGGFTESPYVRRALQKALDNIDIQTVRIADHLKKATIGGAMIGFVILLHESTVNATFGGCFRQIYNKDIHRERKHAVRLDVE